MCADDNVVKANNGSQRADRENERERSKPGRHEGEADDVRLARAPVAIEKGGSPIPVNIARSMHTRRFDKRFSHELCGCESPTHRRAEQVISPRCATRPA